MVKSHSSHWPIDSISTANRILHTIPSRWRRGKYTICVRARGITTKWRTLERRDEGGERKGDGGLQGATNAAGRSGERRASGDGTAGREG